MSETQDLDWSQPRVATERVVPALSSPVLHGALAEAFDEPWELTELVESEIVKPELVDDGPADRQAPPEQWFAPRRSDFELAVFVGAAIILAAGDIGLGVLCGAFLVGAAAIRRLPFSFGEGFIGYRPDMGWPQGVQEDDDFHWSWKKVPGR